MADRRSDRRDNHDKRAYSGDRSQPKRVNRPGRANRRVVTRRPIYASNGSFAFHNGIRRSYARPVIQARYYNVRVRPQLVVENYDAVEGYVWVRGGWNWNGREWQWNSGHYAPDMQYSNYYDDGSFDYSVSFSGRIGG